jgi:hypothetical protein
VTKYYLDHPSQRALNVLVVWQKSEPKGPQPKPPSGGETWANPHWYLNGGWWQTSRRGEREGFLEGYLWCMRTRVKPPRPNYSQPVNYYVDKISEYIKTHDAYEKSIASILARYQDKRVNASN